MNYGKIIYDFIKIDDVPLWEELVGAIQQIYNDLAIRIIREYIKDSPL